MKVRRFTHADKMPVAAPAPTAPHVPGYPWLKVDAVVLHKAFGLGKVKHFKDGFRIVVIAFLQHGEHEMLTVFADVDLKPHGGAHA